MSHTAFAVEWLAQHVARDAIEAASPDVILFLAGTNDFFWPPPRGARDAGQRTQPREHRDTANQEGEYTGHSARAPAGP